MSGSNFTVGFDTSWVATAPNGTKLDLTGLINVEWTPEYKTPRSEPLNGPPQERNLPYGHRLALTVDRYNPQIEELFSQIEQGWWALGSVDQGTSNNGTVYLYENNPDGSQTTHQFWQLTMKLGKMGPFKTDTHVQVMIDCFAARWQVAS
jgi:hypothetical protein